MISMNGQTTLPWNSSFFTGEGARWRFVGQHLAKWITPFSAAVQAGAETAFYRKLALLTERIVNINALVGYLTENSRTIVRRRNSGPV